MAYNYRKEDRIRKAYSFLRDRASMYNLEVIQRVCQQYEIAFDELAEYHEPLVESDIANTREHPLFIGHMTYLMRYGFEVSIAVNPEYIGFIATARKQMPDTDDDICFTAVQISPLAAMRNVAVLCSDHILEMRDEEYLKRQQESTRSSS